MVHAVLWLLIRAPTTFPFSSDRCIVLNALERSKNTTPMFLLMLSRCEWDLWSRFMAVSSSILYTRRSTSQSWSVLSLNNVRLEPQSMHDLVCMLNRCPIMMGKMAHSQLAQLPKYNCPPSPAPYWPAFPLLRAQLWLTIVVSSSSTLVSLSQHKG